MFTNLIWKSITLKNYDLSAWKKIIQLEKTALKTIIIMSLAQCSIFDEVCWVF